MSTEYMFLHWFSILFIGGGFFFLTAGVIFTASGICPPHVGAIWISMSLMPLLVGWSIKALQLAGCCREDSSNPYLEKDEIVVSPKIDKIKEHLIKQVSKSIDIFMYQKPLEFN